MNSRFTAIFLVILALLSPVGAKADQLAEEFRSAHGDFFYLLRSDRSDVQLGYMIEPGQETKSGSTEFDVEQFYGKFEVPVPLSEDSYLRAGFDFNARRYDFSRSDGSIEGISNETFHRVTGLFGAGTFLSDNLLLNGALQLGVFSNFGDGLDGDDFDVRGETMLVYRLNPSAQLLVGAKLSEDFEDTSLIPLLGLRLLSEDGKLHINLTVPLELRVGYNVFQPFQVFGRVTLSGERYNFTDGPGGANGELRVQDRRIGGGFSWWLGSYVNLECEAGFSFDSEIEFQLDGRPDFDREIDSAGYLRAQLGFGF